MKPLSEPPYRDRWDPEADVRLAGRDPLFRHFMYCQLRAPPPSSSPHQWPNLVAFFRSRTLSSSSMTNDGTQQSDGTSIATSAEPLGGDESDERIDFESKRQLTACAALAGSTGPPAPVPAQAATCSPVGPNLTRSGTGRTRHRSCLRCTLPTCCPADADRLCNAAPKCPGISCREQGGCRIGEALTCI